jgi:hypothetical protein
MEHDDLMSVENVLVMSEGLVLICEINGRRFGVPRGRIARSSQMRNLGDRGRLVVPRELAVDLGMLKSERSPMSGRLRTAR